MPAISDLVRMCHLMEGDNATPSVSRKDLPFNRDSGRNPSSRSALAKALNSDFGTY